MRIVRGLVVVSVGLAVAWAWWPRGIPDETAAAAPSAPAETYAEPPAAVGWVFGRLMGFPGADRPLMSGSYPVIPPASRSAGATPGVRR